MKLYKIYQTVNDNWDTYDSCVVAAENETEAKKINPGGFYEMNQDNKWEFVYADGKREEENDRSWAELENIKVEYLGEAKDGTKRGVIVASFNAG